MIGIGAWLFRHRGWLPVPLVLLMVAMARPERTGWGAGLAVIALGELVRLWGVAHIGAKSRTRSASVGQLCRTGPYRIGRNPLYVGNIAAYSGLALMTGRPGLTLFVLVLFSFHYNLIVRWEETRLRSQLGASYEAYCAEVPRWFRFNGMRPGRRGLDRSGDWLGAVRSERSTLLALLTSISALIVWSCWGWRLGVG